MPLITHARVCPPGPHATAWVITPVAPAEARAPRPDWTKSLMVTSMCRAIPAPLMPTTSCRRLGEAASQASKPTWTFTWSQVGHVADTVGSAAAVGPR
jgi:hypothetical protein